MTSVSSSAGPPDSKPEAAVFAEPDGGGRDAAPAVAQSPHAAEPVRGGISAGFARFKDSVWLTVGARIAGIAVGMLALAGIGAAFHHLRTRWRASPGEHAARRGLALGVARGERRAS